MLGLSLSQAVAILLGALVLRLMEKGLGIELKCAAWKEFVFRVALMVWGGIILKL